MWLMKSESSEARDFYMIPGIEYQIGRKDCLISLLKDTSISRKHSIIKIEGLPAKEIPEITLTDYSKYGTKVNGAKVTGAVSLKENDVVWFGQSHHKFRLLRYPIVVSMSCIVNKDMKASIRQNITRLGGEIRPEWSSDCTHLIMEAIKFTIKVVCTISSGCPIVTPDYFEDMVKIIEDPFEQPKDLSMFMPEVKEPTLLGQGHLFKPSLARQTIFSGKEFIILSDKQFARLSQAILLAGGSAELKEPKDLESVSSCFSDDTILIAPEPKDEAAVNRKQRHFFQAVKNKVLGLNFRPIKESEVGLAILHLSLESNCNPQYFSDDSNAKGLSSQAMHDTNIDQTCQRIVTSSTSTAAKPQGFLDTQPEKKSEVLAGDSQEEQERKRKRLSDTSMYITDTVPIDEPLPFHLAKRSKRKSSDEQTSLDAPIEPVKQSSSAIEKELDQKTSREELKGRNCDEKKIESGSSAGRNKEKEEIEDLANSLLEDDDDFGEDFLAEDTERRLIDGRDQNVTDHTGMRNTDKSRVAESQFWEDVNDKKQGDLKTQGRFRLLNKRDRSAIQYQESQDTQRSRTNVKGVADFISEDKDTAMDSDFHEKDVSQRPEVSRVGDSQLTECHQEGQHDILLESKRAVTEFVPGTMRSISSEKTPPVSDVGAFNSSNPRLDGFQSARMGQRTNDVKPEIDPDQPVASTVVSFSALVVRRPRKPQQLPLTDSNVKNFKKFRKSFFPGGDRVIPRIIGGNDLIAFKTEDQSKLDVFDQLREAYAKEERERKEDEDLFKVDLKPTRRTKKLAAR